jgi:Domain of unknown function (DUF5916)/Carbohydrate family 9 binding domain-like
VQPKRVALVAAVSWPAIAVGAGLEPADSPLVRATRGSSRITLDGRPDEPAWNAAAPFDAFVQVFPAQGAAPSEPTELRVLYDDHYLYFAFRCRDSRPGLIGRKLGRRDAPPASDTVDVAIDFTHDHRTAYLFGVNAGGVQYDGLLYADNRSTMDWDGVWEAAVASDASGWTAELAIPLALFRFGGADVQRWGFLARRHVARSHEDMFSVFISRGAAGAVSLFGHLDGLAGLDARRDLELVPYTAARLVIRPERSDPTTPAPRLGDPSLDVGLDLRAGLTRQLHLNATLNPDFGQVEADQIILNLSNQEAFFPEKRPFFFQGTEVFQPVTAETRDTTPQMLFYSRRIGLATPILGALKVVGGLGSHLNIGLLDAYVSSPVTASDRRVGFHPERPFHLAPNDEVARAPAVPENYLAGVLQYRTAQGSTIGGRVASAVPLAGRCDAAEAALDPERRPLACDTFGGNAAAADWNLQTAGAEWVFLGQAEGSQTLGGPPVRTLPDGVALARGEAGWGTSMQAGRMGGEPFRFDLSYSYISPTLELNGAGFLPTQNEQQATLTLRYARPSGLYRLHSFEGHASAGGHRTTDGRAIDRGRRVGAGASALLPGFHSVGFDTGYRPAFFDVRDVIGTGIPLERPPTAFLMMFVETDANRVVAARISLALGWHLATAVTPLRVGWTASLNLSFRPENRLESRLDLVSDRTPYGPHWTRQTAGERLLFGDLDSQFVSATFRQQLVLFPRLTIQAYGQLFTAFGHYHAFFEAASPDRAPLRLRDLVVTGSTAPGFQRAALSVNLVLRWEYRLGSTIYAVYTHASESLPTGAGEAVPVTLAPENLFRGPATDGFMVKWSYWWDV